MSPLSITLITALIGAVVLAVGFARSQRPPLMGALLGAAAGAIGPQIFMVPIGYCSLEPENHVFFQLIVLNQPITVNAALGLTVILIAIGVWAMLLLFDRAHAQIYRTGRLLPTLDLPSGAFRGWGAMPWLLLAPTLIVLLLFTYYPALSTLSLSTQLARLGVPRTAPVCLNNFATLITGPRQNAEYYILSEMPPDARLRGAADQPSQFVILSWRNAAYMDSLMTSLFLSLFIVLFANVFGLLIALASYQPIKGARIYRTLLIWPYALSAVVSGIVFYNLFNPLTGIINYTLGLFGIPGVRWLLEPTIAPWVVVFAATWNILGFNLLFYIAGLQNVPKDLLEAAAIDGANVFQRFWTITIPMLSPFIFFLIFTNLTYSFFDLFGLIDNLTTGGPSRATTNLIYDIYVTGIQNKDLGRAAAQSLVLLLIVIGLTVAQFRFLGRRVNYGV
jgi:sn-glycerol 3-phosphate transport system permease protein